jgi:hypothetical protein
MVLATHPGLIAGPNEAVLQRRVIRRENLTVPQELAEQMAVQVREEARDVRDFPSTNKTESRIK